MSSEPAERPGALSRGLASGEAPLKVIRQDELLPGLQLERIHDGSTLTMCAAAGRMMTRQSRPTRN